MANSPITAVRLPPKQHDALRRAAAQTGTSISEVVRSELPSWVVEGLGPRDRVTLKTDPNTGRTYYEINRAQTAAPAKPAPTKAAPAPVVPAPAQRAHRAPAAKPAGPALPAPVAAPRKAPVTVADHISAQVVAVKAKDLADRSIGADGLDANDRAAAAKMTPAQAERFRAIRKQHHAQAARGSKGK
jgi:hypothetical protein